MAKKTSRKISKAGGKKTGRATSKGTRKAAKRPTAKAASKAARKTAKARSKKTARAGGALAPKPITTGRGPTPAEVGKDFVEMFNRGQFKEIEEKYWSPKVTSIEGVGVALAWQGRRAVLAKNHSWSEQNILHSFSAEGPYVGATGFAMKMRMEVEEKATGNRVQMEEVGVYTVQNGKVIQEEFMYGSMTPVSGPMSSGAAENPADTRREVGLGADETPEAAQAMGAF